MLRQYMKCLEVNFRQCTYCLQNLGITCLAYSFSPLHEMPTFLGISWNALLHRLPVTYIYICCRYTIYCLFRPHNLQTILATVYFLLGKEYVFFIHLSFAFPSFFLSFFLLPVLLAFTNSRTPSWWKPCLCSRWPCWCWSWPGLKTATARTRLIPLASDLCLPDFLDVELGWVHSFVQSLDLINAEFTPEK